ncbi:hypothetical protein [Aureispira sp. CCB-QB1]|uniref:hypothetical protein n=1 Tax=Aureispira sp. CCB-QB1 TaxID=1313421 RepID=UPI000697A969|nr:hypothetical protein [Aureispira sp. CCB-QB1]
MGSIHISISKKNTDEFVGLTPLCRDSSLESYCENSLDDILQDFDYDLNMGLSLDKENIDDFLNRIQYVIKYLKDIPNDKRLESFDSYNEDIFNYFIKRLETGKKYLENFIVNNNIEEYVIEVS